MTSAHAPACLALRAAQTSDSASMTGDESVVTVTSTGEEWPLTEYFGARIGVVAQSIAISCAMEPLSSRGSDSLYPRIRVACERFPVHARDGDRRVQAEVPAPVPFEDFDAVGDEPRKHIADERRRCAVRGDTERVS
jgi:hypothetical protein